MEEKTHFFSFILPPSPPLSRSQKTARSIYDKKSRKRHTTARNEWNEGNFRFH